MTSSIAVEYKKRRSEFGRSTKHFCMSEVGTVVNLERNEYRLAEFVEKSGGISEGTSITPMSVHSINTSHISKKNSGMLHLEGGWPKDITMLQRIEQLDQRNRFVKRIEKQEDFQEELRYCSKKALEVINQNNCVDMYEQYFTSPQEDLDDRSKKKSKYPTDGEESLTPAPTQTNLIRPVSSSQRNLSSESLGTNLDPETFMNDLRSGYSYGSNGVEKEEISLSLTLKHDRPINNISWNTTGTRVGVSYSRQYEENYSYIWTLTNSISPEFKLTPLDSLTFLEFHPKKYSLIIGGNQNGIIELFDIRRGVKSVNYSVESHNDKINDIKWIQSKNLNQCVSVSNDEKLYYWDIRNLGNPILKYDLTNLVGEKPVQSRPMTPQLSARKDPEKKESDLDGELKAALNGTAPSTTSVEKDALNGLSLSYDSEYSISKLLIGTKEGKVLSFNKKSKKREKLIERVFDDYSNTSPVYSVQRNPYFRKFFFAVSDWSVRLWHDDFPNTPLFETDCTNDYLLDGKWNPADSSVMYTTSHGGKFMVWDFATNQRDCVLEKKISEHSLNRVEVFSNDLIACSDTKGDCFILKYQTKESIVSGRMGNYKDGSNGRGERKKKNELFKKLLDREYKKEKYLYSVNVSK